MSANAGRPVLAVMARVPREGAPCKTRLSPVLDAPARLRLYESMLRDRLVQLARASRFRALVAVAPPDSPEAMAPLARACGLDAVLHPQRGEDLGARLRDVFAHGLSVLGAPAACVVDSDTPTLGDHLLEEAAEVLSSQRADVVLGPSLDGGYYLIGLAREQPTLFEGIAWSTSTVREATLARARVAGLRVHELATLRDVDEPADLEALGADVARGIAVCGPHTLDALAELTPSCRT